MDSDQPVDFPIVEPGLEIKWTQPARTQGMSEPVRSTLVERVWVDEDGETQLHISDPGAENHNRTSSIALTDLHRRMRVQEYTIVGT